MAADVLTYNALAEVNQELKAESAALTAAITAAESGGGGGGGAETTTQEIMRNAYSPNAGLWCMIPTGSASSEADPHAGGWSGGIKVCDTSNYRRSG